MCAAVSGIGSIRSSDVALVGIARKGDHLELPVSPWGQRPVGRGMRKIFSTAAVAAAVVASALLAPQASATSTGAPAVAHAVSASTTPVARRCATYKVIGKKVAVRRPASGQNSATTSSRVDHYVHRGDRVRSCIVICTPVLVDRVLASHDQSCMTVSRCRARASEAHTAASRCAREPPDVGEMRCARSALCLADGGGWVWLYRRDALPSTACAARPWVSTLRECIDALGCEGPAPGSDDVGRPGSGSRTKMRPPIDGPRRCAPAWERRWSEH